METDREWEIFELEVEARHLAMMEEFLRSKMRPRDLAQLTQENNGETQQLAPPTGGIAGEVPTEG